MGTFITDTIGLGVPAEQAQAFEAIRIEQLQSSLALMSEAIQSNITAVGTTLSASVTQLTGDVCLIGSCSRGSNDSVQLRTFAAGKRRVQVVINRSGSLCQVFPPVGGSIGLSAVGALYATAAAFSLANNQTAEFYAIGEKEYWPGRNVS